MKWFAYAFSFLCLALAVQIAVTAWPTIKATQHLETRDYITYLQILITFITAVLLAAFNFAATRSNTQITARLNRESSEALALVNRESSEMLARLKVDLDIETSKSVERIRSEFTTSVNAATERLKFELNKSSEDFKARLGQTIPQRYNGYHLMFKAATKYFFAIRRLEEGIYPADDLKAASQAADDAIGSSLIVDKEDRDEFFAFVTNSHVIAETARATQPGEDVIVLWEKEGKKYGRTYSELEEKFSAKVRS
jgi:S1-C subfamily serine protease